MPEREITRAELLAAARDVARQAYAPYSHFRVGAAVLVTTAEGHHMVTGANVENASFGLALCAERAALAAACALPSDRLGGLPPRITRLALACVDAPADAPLSARMPCGACRQWIAELAPDALISVDGPETDFTLADLLPHAFELDR